MESINIEYIPSEDAKKLGELNLYWSEPYAPERVLKKRIDHDFEKFYEHVNTTDCVAFDFLIFSSAVYSVDRTLKREVYADDCWKREFNVRIPCKHADLFNEHKEKLKNAIDFLTGDSWMFDFYQEDAMVVECQNVASQDNVRYISLFSGGLDSLLGVIKMADELIDDEKIIMIGHHDLGKEKSDQKKVNKVFDEVQFHSHQRRYLKGKLGIQRRKSEGQKYGNDSTFRSRSLLFFGMGIFIANSVSDSIPLIVPENGTISLNLPLNKSRRSACSTRTTHPTFINRLTKALISLGIHNPIENCYKFYTKGEMMAECLQNENTHNIIEMVYNLSCSCAKRGHNYFWDKSSSVIRDNHITHCGMCLPCIYRRVSLHHVGLDSPDEYGTDVMNGNPYDIDNLKQKRGEDFRNLLAFIRKIRNMSDSDIKRELVITGVEYNEDLDSYVDLIRRSYNQVERWIEGKGSRRIKQLAGL